MKDRKHWEECDFEGATELAGVGEGGTQSYYFECEDAGAIDFLACSVASHCADGQKLEVNTSATERVTGSSGETLIHARSLAQVMTLLGAPAMDRGYQTETMAEHTLEVIWCLEDHCPGSALDWDQEATESSCRADVHNLAGFVSRKRPDPQFDKAREYYDEALRFEPDHCPTLQYLTELNLQTGNASGALATAGHACSACGVESEYGVAAIAALVDAGMELPSACAPLGAGAIAAIVIGSLAGAGALAAARNFLAVRRTPRQAPLKSAALSAKEKAMVPAQTTGDLVHATPATQAA